MPLDQLVWEIPGPFLITPNPEGKEVIAMLHPFTQIRMQNRREDIARGLAARPHEEVEAIFEKCQASFDRIDAFESGDWVRYVELGGNIEIARKADPLSFRTWSDLSDFD